MDDWQEIKGGLSKMAPAVDDLETPLSMTLSDHDANEPHA